MLINTGKKYESIVPTNLTEIDHFGRQINDIVEYVCEHFVHCN